MVLFHGTDLTSAQEIEKGHVAVEVGGGELGQGFYTGDLSFRAYNWAWHRYQKSGRVVKIDIDDDDFVALDPLVLDNMEVYRRRNAIRDSNQTRTFLFNRNAVWGPVVGSSFKGFEQVKFESKVAESFINGTSVKRNIQ